jgi:hypothetical protein
MISSPLDTGSREASAFWDCDAFSSVQRWLFLPLFEDSIRIRDIHSVAEVPPNDSNPCAMFFLFRVGGQGRTRAFDGVVEGMTINSTRRRLAQLS